MADRGLKLLLQLDAVERVGAALHRGARDTGDELGNIKRALFGQIIGFWENEKGSSIVGCNVRQHNDQRLTL